MMKLPKLEEFAKPFDPIEKLEDEEKFKARSEFWSLIDDVLLANMSEVTVSEHKEIIDIDEDGECTYNSHLEAWYGTEIIEHTSEGRYRRHLEVIVVDAPGNRSVQIREMDKKGTHRQANYLSSSSSLDVLRVDTDNDQGYASSGSEPASIDTLTAGLKRLANEAENYQQEVAMGLNNQPVASEEIVRLRQLLIS